MTYTIYIKRGFLMLLCFSFLQNYAQEKQLNLEAIKVLALQNNKTIKKAQYNLEAANAAEKSSKTANKPSLDASAMGIYINQPPLNLIPETMVYTTLGVTQVLYAGGKVTTAKKIASTAVALQTSQKELTQSEVLLNVITTYWQYLNVKEKVALAKEYQQLLGELSTDLSNSYAAGLIYKNDLLKVQVESNQAALNLSIAEDNLWMLKLKIAQLIGVEISSFIVETHTIEAPISFVEKNANASTVESRPEIAMLENAVTIGDLKTNLLKADRKPTLGINLSGSYLYGEDLNAAENEDFLTNFIGVASLKIPIFDWGGRKQRVKEQYFKVEAQKTELEETKELVAIEIENSYLKLNQAVKRVSIEKKSLEQANENLKLQQDRFNAGTVKGSDVLEAQVLWQQAYSNVIDAQANYHINSVTYLKATGALH